MSEPAKSIVYVIEQLFRGDTSWVPCDVSLWFRSAHQKKRELQPRWPDYRFRVRRYYPS